MSQIAPYNYRMSSGCNRFRVIYLTGTIDKVSNENSYTRPAILDDSWPKTIKFDHITFSSISSVILDCVPSIDQSNHRLRTFLNFYFETWQVMIDHKSRQMLNLFDTPEKWGALFDMVKNKDNFVNLCRADFGKALKSEIKGQPRFSQVEFPHEPDTNNIWILPSKTDSNICRVVLLLHKFRRLNLQILNSKGGDDEKQAILLLQEEKYCDLVYRILPEFDLPRLRALGDVCKVITLTVQDGKTGITINLEEAAIYLKLEQGSLIEQVMTQLEGVLSDDYQQLLLEFNQELTAKLTTERA